MRRLFLAFRLYRSTILAESACVGENGRPEWLLVARPSCFVADLVEALTTGTATSCDRIYLIVSGHSKHLYNSCSEYERSVVVRNVEMACADHRDLGYRKMFKIARKSIRGGVVEAD